MTRKGCQMSFMAAHLGLQLELSDIDSFLPSVPILTFVMDSGVPTVSSEHHDKWCVRDPQPLSPKDSLVMESTRVA
ncbi:GDSL esterase/lipase [Pyrus ussuriensis x Pyrus communis]|uniref:GDSL esterase/lipase n=1 Tax=Pyrus ussuriensis x Pyrus communis TaxID=2448454 RepID=A0A5N5FS10_9ROSA|nr:GDSL esterase/lipase [Pyrus ussuriensis x Pyrus communis]